MILYGIGIGLGVIGIACLIIGEMTGWILGGILVIGAVLWLLNSLRILDSHKP